MHNDVASLTNEQVEQFEVCSLYNICDKDS